MNTMRKKIIALIIIIISKSVILFATNTGYIKVTLSGKITDKATGETIPGATIYVPDLKTGAISDTSGIYQIDNLPKTKILLQISFLGYKTIVEKVDLTITQVENFSLEPSITEMQDVVVTGSSIATEIKRSPIPITALNRIELQQSLNSNIIDAVAKVPGVSAVTTGPNVSKPFIHGLGYNRVLTLYDNVRQEGQQWGDEHGIEIDENSVDRIEVIKGPASLSYGSDALAGVLNLLPAPPVPDGTIKGKILTDYHTNNNQINGSTILAGNKKGFIWGGIVSHKQAENYQNKNDGRVYGTSFSETDFSGYIGLNKQWGYSHLNFSIFDDLQEIPNGSRDSATRKFTKQITEIDTFRPIVSSAELNSYKIATLHQHVQHYKLYSSNNFILGESKLGLIFGYQQSVRREFSHPEYPEIQGLYLVLNTFTYDIKFYLPEFDEWVTTFGVNGMYQNNTNKGTEFIIPNYSQFDVGPFALVQRSFDKLNISAGLRYDARYFNNDAMYTRPNPQTGFDMQVSSPIGSYQPFYSFKHTFTGMSGSIGATYKISDKFLIKGNIARGFRAPNISEISANGVHPGTMVYQIGNTSFKPEFSLQEDFGISFSSSHILGYLEIFNNNISNYIFNQNLLNVSGKDSIIVKGNQTFKFQQAQAQLYGGEASIDIHPHPFDWLHFENSVSVVYALNKGGNGTHINDSSKFLPFIPPLHTNSDLRANFKRKLGIFSSLYVKIGIEFYAKQDKVYLANNTETVTPGYMLYNAGAGAEITNKQGKALFSIDILGNNITNIAYQSNMSRLKYMDFYINKSGNPVNLTGPGSGIFNMGRNISFKLTIPLNF
jgi:iron complex outermembrane recepter protein